MSPLVKSSLLALAMVPLLLAGCASPGRYPSLAIRDAERATGQFATPKPEPYVPPATPADVIDRLAQLTAQARTADEGFAAAADKARAPVNAARGAEPGSERWSVAQVALADLQARRSQAMIALADLDRLYVEAQLQGAELTPIATAREQVDAIVQQENDTLSAMLGVVGS